MKIRKPGAPTDFGVANDENPADGPGSDDLQDAPAAALQIVTPLTPPLSRAEVATQDPRTPATQPEPATSLVADPRFRAPSPWPTYLTALGVSVLWAFAPIAFAVGYRSGVVPLQDDPFALAVFGLLSIGPAALVFGAAYVIRQGQKLAAETRRAKAMAEEMLTPALTAAARAGEVVRGVRDEIIRAGQATDDARETLLALREALAQETAKLAETTAVSLRTAEGLAEALDRERGEMGQLAQVLDAQATRVTDSITQQARMVAEASDLAETQLREAEAALASSAADLAAAAAEASAAARTAGEDLGRHIGRLETAGAGVTDQIRAVEGGLAEQRTAMVALTQALRGDQQTFSSQAETHAATLSGFIDQARLSAAEMGERAAAGGEALQGLIAAAADQFRDLSETAKAEREEFDQSTLQSMETVASAAAARRARLEAQTRTAIEALSAAAEETRQAAERHATVAREQVDQLSEAAFTAGQKANQVFEARLAEARSLVEQSSQMVEQAGATTARKLDAGASAARATLEELAGMLTELEQRAALLPAAARGQADQVRAAVAHGMDELIAQARRTAEEAEAIDAAFQDRVRRNFETLSEAVRLMGAAAHHSPLPPPSIGSPPARRPAAGRLAAALGGARPAITALREEAPPEPTAANQAEPAAMDAAEPATALEAAPLDEQAEPGAPQPGLATLLGLRPRLKLTPTATDAEFAAVFESAGGRPAEAVAPSPAEAAAEKVPDKAAAMEWSWKNLLASIDGIDGEGPRLQETLLAELGKMGVEPSKLLPKARVDEVAAAVQTGDLEGARQVVKRLAPAATRRIGRRMFTDQELKRQVGVFIHRYQGLVDDAAVQDPEGFLMAGLLGADAGRLYLLLDAAAGDMI
ncbi:MAG: polar localization protein TipN [Phenylobacterium sp.]